MGFLKACNKLLAKIIALITTACLKLEYFPQRFCCAEVVVLAKARKTSKIVYTPDAYRSVALLCVIDKVIKKTMNKRIAAAAEKYNLLLQGQMGNCLKRLTELAIPTATPLVLDFLHASQSSPTLLSSPSQACLPSRPISPEMVNFNEGAPKVSSSFGPRLNNWIVGYSKGPSPRVSRGALKPATERQKV